MDINRLIIISFLLFQSVNNFAFCQTKDTELTIKATLIGSYSNPLDDSCYYFLVEIKLINKTDSLCEFVTYSCSALINIIWDTKKLTLFYPNCASNYPTTIRVNPNQEYSLPIIFQTKRISDEAWPIWKKEVSEFDWEYDETETCYLLEGEVVVTSDNGKPVSFGLLK